MRADELRRVLDKLPADAIIYGGEGRGGTPEIWVDISPASEQSAIFLLDDGSPEHTDDYRKIIGESPQGTLKRCPACEGFGWVPRLLGATVIVKPDSVKPIMVRDKCEACDSKGWVLA